MHSSRLSQALFLFFKFFCPITFAYPLKNFKITKFGIILWTFHSAISIAVHYKNLVLVQEIYLSSGTVLDNIVIGFMVLCPLLRTGLTVLNLINQKNIHKLLLEVEDFGSGLQVDVFRNHAYVIAVIVVEMFMSFFVYEIFTEALMQFCYFVPVFFYLFVTLTITEYIDCLGKIIR